jgi:hypothetical protein
MKWLAELGHDLFDMNVADWKVRRAQPVGHALTIGAAFLTSSLRGGASSAFHAHCGEDCRSAGLRGVEGRSQCSRAAHARRWGKDNIRCNYIAPCGFSAKRRFVTSINTRIDMTRPWPHCR